MNEQPVALAPDRSTRAAHFHARLTRYKNLLRKRWWILLLGAVLAVAVEVAIIYHTPPSFTSIARMIVNIKLNIAEGSVYADELSNFLGTQMELMRSGEVMSRAHARVAGTKPESAARPIDLKVTVSPKTSIFVLRATGETPEYTRSYLQACMEEYISLRKEMRSQTSDSTLAGLTGEVVRSKEDLRKAEDEIVAFESTNSIVLLQEQGNSAGGYLGSLNRQIVSLKSEHQLLQTLTLEQNLERERQKSTLPSTEEGKEKEGPLQTATYGTDSEYLKARQQLLLLKAEKQELGEFLRPKHPKMIALTEDIDRKERLLEIFRQQTKEQLESKKSSLALQIGNLEKDIKEWEVKVLETSRKMAEYQRMKLNVQRIQSLYDRLLATMQTLDVSKGINPESVTIMERASPAMPERPRLLKSLLTACFFGMGLGALLLLFLDRLDDRLSSFTDLHDLFEENILGQIPSEKANGKGGQLALLHPQDNRHGFVEAYRNLRSSLFYISESTRRPRLLLVTSSIPGDGKSMTAANLAIIMANAGSKVLLVDGDLRKGILHERFSVKAQPGLTEVLQKAITFSETIIPSSIPNLFLLPRGASVHNSSELLLSPVAEEFLKTVATLYDYVLVDSPPVMAADDATSFGPHMDGVVFVIRAEHTSARVARAALNALYQRNAPVLGLVFNAVRANTSDYYYYKYKEYYKAYPTA